MHLPRLRHRTRNRPQFDYGQNFGNFGTCFLQGKPLGFLATKLICTPPNPNNAPQKARYFFSRSEKNEPKGAGLPL